MPRSLEAHEEQLIRCSRCGACQTVCPVFKELQSEAMVARGKIQLIRGVLEKKIPLTEGFAERMSWCLMCKACYENCGSSVETDRVVEAARAEIIRRKGMPWLEKFIFHFGLKNRWVFNAGMRMGSMCQWLLFRHGPDGKGMLPRLPLGIDRRRLLASLSDRPLKTRYPETVKVPHARMRVAFFTGCLINYMYPDIGAAVVEVLKRNDVEVVIPALQHCCGSPVRVSGDYEPAMAMARANIDVLLKEEYDAVVVACASCGSSLKEEYAEMLADDPVYAERAKRLAAKVKDFSELVVNLGRFDSGLGQLDLTVTYHDPCHLGRAQGVKDQPRQIIKNIPGVVLREMADPGRCCGGAGSFSLHHYELSTRINDRKIEDAGQTGVGVLVTGCPNCMMHINDGFHRNNLPVKVVHTAQLLNMAYKAAETGHR
jgi:glycolate oxidase iron-sulfur subunit